MKLLQDVVIPVVSTRYQELWCGNNQEQFILHFTRYAAQYGPDNLVMGYNPGIHCWKILRVVS